MPSVLSGILLAESLRLDAAIEVPGLRATRIYRADVSESSTSGQPSTWTFVEFQAEDDVAGELSESLAKSLLAEGGWYADFKVQDEHVVVFAEAHLPLLAGR
jgi:hypothetical protein